MQKRSALREALNVGASETRSLIQRRELIGRRSDQEMQ